VKGIKVVIDTSVWVSIIRNNELFNMLNLIKLNDLKIYICGELLTELFDVFYRPKHYEKFNIQIDDFFNLFEFVTTTFSIKQNRNFTDCPDPKDNYLFDIAIQSQADYLVTGDKTVLDTPIKPPTKIISFTEFREMFV